jgi:hypothetical protein
MRIPTRVAGETIQNYIEDSLALFHKSGGQIVDLPHTLGPNTGRTVARINIKDKII